MSATIIVLETPMESEERLYSELMAAYDVHQTVRTPATYVRAVQALNSFVSARDALVRSDGGRIAPRVDAAAGYECRAPR
jgi:hypothetical protein